MTTSRVPRASTTGVGWFPLALLALLAVGCAATAEKKKKGPRSLSFQVEEDSELWAPSKKAAAEWSKATGRTITVTPDGNIPIFFVPDLDDADCGGDKALGCSYRGDDARIEILQAIPRQHLAVILLHEMGHHLRGSQGHVTSNPNAVMADPIRGSTLTAEDAAYVCERFDCALTV